MIPPDKIEKDHPGKPKVVLVTYGTVYVPWFLIGQSIALAINGGSDGEAVTGG